MKYADCKLHVQGSAEYRLFGTITNLSTGEETSYDLTASGSSFDQIIQLSNKGVYEAVIGGKQMIVIYE